MVSPSRQEQSFSPLSPQQRVPAKPLSTGAQKSQLISTRSKRKPVNPPFFPSFCSHITWPHHPWPWPLEKSPVVRFLHFRGHDANMRVNVLIQPMGFSFIFSLLSRNLAECLFFPLLATQRLCVREEVRENIPPT